MENLFMHGGCSLTEEEFVHQTMRLEIYGFWRNNNGASVISRDFEAVALFFFI
jgi:hypothetical protein